LLVVAEQHGIDCADRFRRERRPGSLFLDDDRTLIAARRIEGWVSQQPESSELD
jgi:hypothetical protein